MTISELSKQTFVQYFGGLYEHSAWIVERAFNKGLTVEHDNPDVLSQAFRDSLAEASVEEKLGLICAHPDLVGKAAIAGELTDESTTEQASAGLDKCTTEEFEKFTQLNRDYKEKFGFPFVMAVRKANRHEILTAFESRFHNNKAVEFERALEEINKIASMRLDVLLQKDGQEKLGLVGFVDVGHGISTSQMQDPDYFPGITKGLPLGIQHVLAMFVSNVTPAIIIAGAVGFGFGSPDTSDMVYMIQMSMFFAGFATLIQTIGMGPVGAKLPVVQGTSFAFIPIMIPVAKVYGMAALMGGIVIGGIFHFFLGTIIGRIRRWLPPLVTGLVVLMIGLALIRVGIQYAAGGVPAIGTPEFGNLTNWSLALIVIVTTLGLKFFAKGMLSISAILIGLLVGYVIAIPLGMVNFGGVGRADWFALPNPLHFGFEVNAAAIIGMCLMGFVSAIETVGDISGITKGGAGREATDEEVAGGTMADGVGTAVAGMFGALPNTSFSQNVGLISMTGLMSRHVVTLGALFLIVCGLIPKIGALIQTMPIAVLGGGVIVMFGMVAAAGVSMLSDVVWNRRNMIIFAIALSVGLGLQLEPAALQHLPVTLKVLLTSGLLPAALIAIILNAFIPTDPIAD